MIAYWLFIFAYFGILKMNADTHTWKIYTSECVTSVEPTDGINSNQIGNLFLFAYTIS